MVFGVSPAQVTFARRGFLTASTAARERLEHTARTFVAGYRAAIEMGTPEDLDGVLGTFDEELRGFAVEGAAMAFALLDLLTPWERGRFDRLLALQGARHAFLLHIGAGWAFAILRRPIGPALARLDPLLGWLAVDGYGFREGYFDHARSIHRQLVPARLSGYARRAFDHGLGRSMWFVRGADSTRVAATISAFSPARRADLWSGVGGACAYAGGAPRAAIESLRELAGEYRAHLAQGAAFAAKAREQAGNRTDHTELACRLLSGVSARDAASLTDEARAGLKANDVEPAYETWRARIRMALAKERGPL